MPFAGDAESAGPQGLCLHAGQHLKSSAAQTRPDHHGPASVSEAPAACSDCPHCCCIRHFSLCVAFLDNDRSATVLHTSSLYHGGVHCSKSHPGLSSYSHSRELAKWKGRLHDFKVEEVWLLVFLRAVAGTLTFLTVNTCWFRFTDDHLSMSIRSYGAPLGSSIQQI